MKLETSLIQNDFTRVVECQSYIATRQLVDSNAEQMILEEMLDESKPPYPKDAQGLDYLLKTPFRYPPLEYGSRFGTVQERGIFYASVEIGTAFCEASYYRLKFLLDSEAELRPSIIGYTSFLASIKCKKGLNLTVGKWEKQRKQISDPISYAHSQEIGSAAREAGIDGILYYSARHNDGINIALFSPACFTSKKSKKHQRWDMFSDYNAVAFSKKDGEEIFVFNLEDFKVGGKFAVIG